MNIDEITQSKFARWLNHLFRPQTHLNEILYKASDESLNHPEARVNENGSNESSSTLNDADHLPQSLNHFPGDNKKQIDYVIYYKETQKTKESKEIKKYRIRFFELLEKEGFDVYQIKYQRDEHTTCIYALLNCSLERLMEQAERIELKWPLKPLESCDIKREYVSLLNFGCFRRMRDFITKIFHGLNEPSEVSATFQAEIKHIFVDFERDIHKSKGFSSEIRCLLVDNILKHINLGHKLSKTDDSLKNQVSKALLQKNNESYDQAASLSSTSLKSLASNSSQQTEADAIFKQIKLSTGLPFMLNAKYFDDAFILHDQSDMIKKKINSYLNFLDSSQLNLNIQKDLRANLREKWAKLGKIFLFQPTMQIKNYFGEYVAFYFCWCGAIISSLWPVTLAGLCFFVFGLVRSLRDETNAELLLYPKINSTASLAKYGYFSLTVFAQSFDNETTPYYAVLICLWGIALSEYWTRESAKLAYHWNVQNYKKVESNRVEYTRQVNIENAKCNKNRDYYPEYKRYAKTFVSSLFVIFMILNVAVQIACVVAYRIYINKKIFPNDDLMAFLVGDFGSVILSLTLIIILENFYKYFAYKLTKWEVPRTKTDFDNNYTIKLFAFEFLNCYGSFFYIAFFRQIDYENGIFNLGKEYQDKCDDNNCMLLLSLQCLVILLLKTIPRFVATVVIPIIYIRSKEHEFKKKLTWMIDSHSLDHLNTNELQLFVYVTLERIKPNLKRNIMEEYIEKVTLYGYVVLFASSLTLGPLILLFILLIDIRMDAKRFLWLFRRALPYKTENIGIFHGIVQFLNVCGIVSNGFLLAFTSKWSKTNFGNNTQSKLIFVIVFEHTLFYFWLLIKWLLPQNSNERQAKMSQEVQYTKEIILSAKCLEKAEYRTMISGDTNASMQHSQRTKKLDIMPTIVDNDRDDIDDNESIIYEISRSISPSSVNNESSNLTEVTLENIDELSPSMFKRKKKYKLSPRI